MYLNAAVLALVAFACALLSGRVDRLRNSGPIVFVLIGVLLGPAVFGVLGLEFARGELRLLAEITLSTVLFTDAANAYIDQSRRVRFSRSGSCSLASLQRHHLRVMPPGRPARALFRLT